MTDSRLLGAVIIGDELLAGKRRDRHLPHLIETLGERGLRLAWCRFEGDDRARLTDCLRQTRAAAFPVLCFGGIGATPDDLTRQAAAEAFGRPLERHPEAVALIEKQFGDQAYPTRVHMADLPQGSGLIPNPWNRIPGFSLLSHYFFPGFPQMAWPMLEWVLEQQYPGGFEPEREYAVRVVGVRESALCELMELLSTRHPQARLFSLPHLAAEPYVELGFRGLAGAAGEAFDDLLRELDARGLRYEAVAAGGD